MIAAALELFEIATDFLQAAGFCHGLLANL